MGIKRISVHPNYDSKIISNDIAILRLNRSVQWNLTRNGTGSINRVCLPSKSGEEYPEGSHVTASGWGSVLHNDKDYPDTLRVARMQVLSVEKCNRTSSKYNVSVTQAQVCASYSTGGPCKGDSGGPLLRFKKGRAELVGIFSYMFQKDYKPCYEPYVFTNVSHHMDWIQQNL